ncbi:MAG TPA: RNA polymerase sigma factor SigJ [Acidimicrobiia bacterium]|nr:RNA polymerase sigma factor SigJ [Acidimicrobiia bacterium]
MSAVDLVEEFARHREYLVHLAYRMLGSFDEAEDVVQDAMVRAGRAEPRDIEKPVAWLTTIVTNLALDRLKSARRTREAYVGPWLPEPAIGREWSEDMMDPADRVTLDEQISLALLTVLETLSPAERAVYVLHEAFAVPLSEVATIVGRTPDAVRQLAVRARRRVQEGAPRFEPDPSEQARVVAAFARATTDGDLDALAQLLDDEVVFRSDGGGVVRAAARPIEGRDRVLQAIRASLKNVPDLELEHRVVNGEPGLVGRFEGGAAVFAFVVRDGRVARIDVVVNPDKLRRLPPA